jgi:hypothetical protein
MKRNSTTHKLGLGIVLAAVVISTEFAASQASYALSRPNRITPELPYYRGLHQLGPSYGPYRSFVLPDGTVTGPIGPDVNGG